jgi:hypothetical protein
VFTDDVGVRSPKGISSIGGAQVDTAQSQFGGASALFDGTGDFLLCDGNVDLSGDFTIECWARGDSSTGTSQKLIDLRSSTVTTLADTVMIQQVSNTWNVFVDGSDRTSSLSFSTGTWYHIALVRSGSNFKFFLDGVENFSYNSASVKDMTLDYPFAIATRISRYAAGETWWDGHIDELRISNTARYTTGFTPSTSAFTNDANTLLLLHMDGTDASTTFVDDNA